MFNRMIAFVVVFQAVVILLAVLSLTAGRAQNASAPAQNSQEVMARVASGPHAASPR
jgi:hypothetical protein